MCMKKTHDLGKAVGMLLLLSKKINLKLCVWIEVIRDIIKALYVSAEVVGLSGRKICEDNTLLIESFFDVSTELSFPACSGDEVVLTGDDLKTNMLDGNSKCCSMSFKKLNNVSKFYFDGQLIDNNEKAVVICISVGGRHWGIRIYIHTGKTKSETPANPELRGAILDFVVLA